MKRFRPPWVLLYRREYVWATEAARHEGADLGANYATVREWNFDRSSDGSGFVQLHRVP